MRKTKTTLTFQPPRHERKVGLTNAIGPSMQLVKRPTGRVPAEGRTRPAAANHFDGLADIQSSKF
jgi:hypothetical protein